MDSVGGAKGLKGTQLVTDWATPPVLNVVRSLPSLPPLLQKFGRDADDLSGPMFIEYRIVVINNYWKRLKNPVFLRNLSAMTFGKNRQCNGVRTGSRSGGWGRW